MSRVVFVYLVLVVLIAAAVVAAPGSLASPHCSGYNGSMISHQQCDSDPYEDGSFDRCIDQQFGPITNQRCDRIYP